MCITSENYFNPKIADNDFTRHGQIEEGKARNNYELKTDSTVFETSVIVSNTNKWTSYSSMTMLWTIISQTNY